MKKGVSPLIAVVLLIAFTLAIGGFVSTWMYDITKSQTTEVVTRSKPECAFAYLNVISNTSEFDNTTDTLSFQIENTGTKSVEITDIQVIYDNGTQVKTNWGARTLASNEIMSITNVTENGSATINNSIKKVRILTDCPGKILDIAGGEIDGAA